MEGFPGPSRRFSCNSCLIPVSSGLGAWPAARICQSMWRPANEHHVSRGRGFNDRRRGRIHCSAEGFVVSRWRICCSEPGKCPDQALKVASLGCWRWSCVHVFPLIRQSAWLITNWPQIDHKKIREWSGCLHSHLKYYLHNDSHMTCPHPTAMLKQETAEGSWLITEWSQNDHRLITDGSQPDHVVWCEQIHA